MNELYEVQIMPSQYFLVRFPCNIEIQEWWVHSVKIPKIKRVLYKSGDCCDIIFDSLKIELNVPIMENKGQIISMDEIIYNYFIENKLNNININIELFDKTGVILSRYKIQTKLCINFDISQLKYEKNDFMTIELEWDVYDVKKC